MHWLTIIFRPSLFLVCSPNPLLPPIPAPFIYPFAVRANGGKTPSGLSTSRFGNSNDVEDISTEIETQKRNQAMLKAQCLTRNDNCYILSGLYDSKMARKLSDVERQAVLTSRTEAAHIVPFSLASFTERNVLCFFPLFKILFTNF